MSIVIGVVDKISRVAKFATTTKKGNTLFLHAQEGMDYIVVDKQTGFAPAKIIAVRDGNNLKLFIEGETDPSIVIEDYYVYPAQVIGQTADGTVHNYVPLSSSEQEQVASLNDHQSAPQILDSAQQAPITWDTNDSDWGLITLIAYGLTVAGAMALMINHGGGGKKEEPKVEAPVTNKVVIDDIQDSEAPQIGSVKRGESTNDETPTLHGHLMLNLAADEAVIIYRNDVKIGTAKVAGDGKTWVFEDTHGGLISDNTYTYTARVEHTTGVNKGELSDGYDIIFDNTAPTQSVIITGVADDVAPVIDNVPDNGYTNDTTPLISGILSHPTEKGEYVVVLRNGAEIGKAVVNGTGWTFADSGLNDGETYVYTAVVRDAAGNTGAVSKGYTIHIDTTAPDHNVTLDGIYDDVAPGTGIVGNNGVTNDTTPELRGQIDKVLADNEILVVYRDGVRIGEAEVSGSAWRYTDSGLANDSHYTYSARVEDAAGNTGLYSNEYGINIKFTGPSQLVTITSVWDDVEPVIAKVEHKGWTNDASPDVNGTLSAALNAGEILSVYRDGNKVGNATVNGTSWTYHEESVLADGQHIYTAYVEDAAHNPGAASNNYEINVDTIAPAQTVTLTEITDNKDPVTGKIPQGGETNDDTPTLHGTLSAALNAGEVVAVYRNGVKVGTAVTSGTSWSYEDAGLASGSQYTYYAKVEDLAGNVSQPSNDYSIALNTDGASQSTHILNITDDVAPVTGTVLAGGYTNDSTPTLNGYITSALTGSEEVLIFRDGAKVGTATVNGTTWTYTDSLENNDGHYIYTAVVRDGAGNQGGMSNDYDIYLDTTPPSQTVTISYVIDDEGVVQKNILSGEVTDDKTPTVVGTLDAELDATERVVIYRDGKPVGTATVHGTEWAFTDNLANDATYIYTAKVIDKAGNEGHLSDEFSIIVDTGFPSQTVIITDIRDDKLPQIDTVKNGGYTNDDTPTLNGTLSANLASGEKVVIFRGDTEVGFAVTTGNNWTFTDSGLTDGNTYVYTAVVRNAAGNTGHESDSYTIHMDTSAPIQSVKITGVWDDVAPELGNVGHNGWTNDTAPQVRGTLSAAPGDTEFVVVLRDGVEVGRAAVTGTGWTFDDSGLADGGTYTYTALVRDLAGNSGAVSGGYTIHVDTTAPDTVVTITSVYDDQAPGIGNVKPGETTNDTTPELRGELSKALADNEVLTVYRDGAAVGKAVVTGTAWTYADSGLANDSHYVYTARVEDKAGNTGAYADDYDIYVKFEGPSQTVQITGVNDDVLPVTGNVKSGGWTNDARPDVSGTLSAALGAGEVLIVMRDGVAVGKAVVTGTAWTYSEGADLTDGQHIYTAHVEDAAQNPGATSNRYEINVDTVAPSQAVVLTHIVDNKDPVTGDVEDGAYTNDDTPTLHGTLSAALGAGEILTVWRNGELLTGADVKVDGLTWSYEDSGLASGSDYTYYVQVQDLAGNTGTQSNSHTIKLNTDGASQGTQILSITDDQLPWTGTVKNGESTNDRTPTLNGSVTAALTGTEKVIILRNGSEVGKAVVNGTAWTYTDAEITTDGRYTYTALVRDEAGNAGAKSNDYVMYLDTTAPSQKAVIDGITDDQAPGLYEVANGGSTNDKTPTLHGTLDGEPGAGETLRVFRDGKDVGGAVVTGKTWVFTDNLANDGTYEYKVAVVDAAHNTGAESNVYGMTLDTAVPTQTVTITEIIDDKAPWTGTVKDGGVTNDDTPTLNGTLNAKLAAGETVVIYRDGSYLETATVNADGLSWTYTDKGLQDGTTYVYTAYVRDGAYNLGPVSKDYTISLDTTAPTQTVTITEIIDDKAPWTGTVKDGGVTNDDTPTLNGTLSAKLAAGETVVIYRDGSYLETATVNADGLSWTYTDKGLQDGTTYVYTAYVRDGAYNLGPVSKDYTISLDTTAPTQTVTITEIIDDKAPQVGKVDNGKYTNDDTPTLNGTINAALGKGETVVIFRNGAYAGTATMKADGLSWTYTDNGLTDGNTYEYKAYVRDAAFNEGPESEPYTIHMDSTVPVQTVTITEIMDDKAPGTGKVENGKYTNDDTPTINGTISQALSETEMVAVFRDGIFLDYAKVTGGTNWTLTDTLADDDRYSYTAKVVDKAGNIGPESTEYVINLDTSVPAQTVKITSVLDDVKPFEGNIDKGGYTNDKTPELHGTVSSALKANQVLAIYLNDKWVANVTVNDDLTWQYTGTLSTDGHYTWKAVVETLAGVPGASDEYDINLDTSVPATLATIDKFWDHVGAEQGEFKNGDVTDDRNPELRGSLSQELKVRESVLIFDTTKGAIGSGLEVLMGTAIANGREWAFLVPGDHRLENGSSPKFEALVTNGSTYGKPSADFTLKVDLDINVNVVKTLDTHPIISGSVGFQIYNDEHVKVTVNGKTYSSLDGGVVVDPLNNTWYVKLPANSGLTQGQTYDVVATLYNNDGSVVVKDKTLNEIQVSREPEAPLIPASDDAANKATGMTIGENGAWRIFSNMNVLDQNGDNITNTSSFKTNTLKSNGQQGVYGAMSFIDFDRDGYMDIVGLDSKFADGQQTFKYMPGKNNISSPDNNAVNNEYYAFTMGDSEKRGDGVDPKYSGTGATSANTYSWWGGIALYDKTGDGYTDILFGDRTPNDAQVGGGYNTQLVWNNKGFFQKDVAYVYTTQNGADKDPNFIKYGQTKQATPEKVVSSVDLNNDGNVDLIHGGSSGSNHINSTDASSGTSGRLVVMSNKGDGGFEVSQILDGINSPEFKKSATILGELNGYGFDGQSVVWADFNGDGWLDMFVGSVNASDGAKDLESIILYNDGKGHLAQNTAIGQIGQANNVHVTDKGNVGGALSVDWNMDGKADVVTIPRLDGDGSPLGKGNQDVTLQLNNSLGPVAKFDSRVLYTSVKNGKGTGYSGLLNIDVDWDGRQDLMVFTGTNGAKLISNTNELKEGTAMHIKILDHEGINAFFGNTVKLYDSDGNLVSTQVINHQAGNQTSNSTGLLSFYGLKADETYNAVLLRNVNGVQQNVGAEGRVGDFDIANVNASWGGLTTGKNWDSYVLTAESGTSASNANIGNGVVGTGYNDTFFATPGENAYEGGGGSYLVNGARQWSDKGGIDIVDFKLAGKTNVTVDLRLTDYQETGYGKQKFSNIEGIRGGDGDDTFYSNSADNFFDGGAGNNTFHLGAGGQDTIMYRLLADDNSGGHGVDQINNFWAGTVEATANADIINIKELLVGYNGKAYDDVAKYVNGKAEISDNTITNYLKLENGSLYLDRDGLGGRYQSEKLADIDFGNDPNGDKVDLAMLLANHQIVF